MPGDISTRRVLGENEIIEFSDIDRFRPSLKCDLFIPSYVHSLSIATEFIYDYVLKRFPSEYFNTIHVAGKHPFEDFRKLEKNNLVKAENPSLSIAYSIQYDFNDNLMDDNLVSTNRYIKKGKVKRSFFKYPSKGLYLGMDLEAMMITYTFRFQVNTRAQQLDLYNRLRKVFRLGCTETIDIDCDFHLDRAMMCHMAQEAGFPVDSATNEVLDPWNFISFINAHSQMPVLYKLRLINQRYEYFLRMRNLPVHLDFQTPLDVDEGTRSGMLTNDFNIEFQIPMRFPAPRTFAFYNEGKWIHKINVEPDEGINIISMKVMDIPEENYKGWPMYAHSNYLAEEDETIVKEIDISELFKAPVDVKVDADLDYIIQDAINQFIDPNIFIEVAVYTNDFAINGSGRLPILMDWPNRKILLPSETTNQYYYLAIYIDREYVNSKVVEFTNADTNRISPSKLPASREDEIRERYDETHIIEEAKSEDTNFPKAVTSSKKDKHARFIVNR